MERCTHPPFAPTVGQSDIPEKNELVRFPSFKRNLFVLINRTPQISEYHNCCSLNGRIRCLVNAVCHAGGIVCRPLFNLISTICGIVALIFNPNKKNGWKLADSAIDLITQPLFSTLHLCKNLGGVLLPNIIYCAPDENQSKTLHDFERSRKAYVKNLTNLKERIEWNEEIQTLHAQISQYHSAADQEKVVNLLKNNHFLNKFEDNRDVHTVYRVCLEDFSIIKKNRKKIIKFAPYPTFDTILSPTKLDEELKLVKKALELKNPDLKKLKNSVSNSTSDSSS